MHVGHHSTHAHRSASASADALWRGTDALLETATEAGILVHRLGPLAANRLRRLGQPVPDALRAEERAAILGMRTAAALVERIRASCDGPLVMLKGPEVADLYPSRARRFGDIDILTADAQGIHRALREHGFVEAPDDEILPDDHHHLEPLKWPTISLRVEVHSSPSWLPGMRPPSLDEILEGCVPSVLDIEGVLAPAPVHHTMLMLSHAWFDEPLRTLRDLLDVAALAAAVEQRELDRAASACGLGRIWRTTRRAVDQLFYESGSSFPLRSWARHLPNVRERSVFEQHLTRWLSPFSELPAHRALARTIRVARDEVRPAHGESWGDKVGRMSRALRNPTAPVVRGSRTPDEVAKAEDRGSTL